VVSPDGRTNVTRNRLRSSRGVSLLAAISVARYSSSDCAPRAGTAAAPSPIPPRAAERIRIRVRSGTSSCAAGCGVSSIT